MPEGEAVVPVKCVGVPLLMQVSSTGVAIQWALAFLGCMRHLVLKPAIVLDIDGTILLNQEGGGAKCVLHFQSLVSACVKNEITVFCITARQDDPQNRAYTEKQLLKCGITPVHTTYMRPLRAEYSKYKKQARAHIAGRGFGVLLSIGDQFADISAKEAPACISDTKIYVGQLGDAAQFGIKLPSEFAEAAV
jgi:predicted secreted acid phosphatase